MLRKLVLAHEHSAELIEILRRENISRSARSGGILERFFPILAAIGRSIRLVRDHGEDGAKHESGANVVERVGRMSAASVRLSRS